MKIDATTPAATTAAVTSGALKGTKDEFLRLFMAQLQNQDPFAPKDGSDMVAQLAQFSSVEQATETNKHLADLAAAQVSASNESLSTLVGRTCNATAGDFQLDRGGAMPAVSLTASGVMKGASLVISDANGVEVNRIKIADGLTSAQVTWDGNNASGVPAAPGSYHVAVEPGTSGATITSQWHGRIDAVELTDAGARLRMGGVLLAPTDVRTIGLTSLTTQTGSGVSP